MFTAYGAMNTHNAYYSNGRMIQSPSPFFFSIKYIFRESLRAIYVKLILNVTVTNILNVTATKCLYLRPSLSDNLKEKRNVKIRWKLFHHTFKRNNNWTAHRHETFPVCIQKNLNNMRVRAISCWYQRQSVSVEIKKLRMLWPSQNFHLRGLVLK